ncbi:MAG: sporulation protein [Bacteroidia bacterium]
MGFFDKIKQFFGMGTVSVKLNAPTTFLTTDTQLKGSVTITGKSDQIIESVEIELQEKWSKGKDDDKVEKEFTLGEIKLPGFNIAKDEVKTVEFSLPFELVKSQNDKMKDQGGIVGGLGKFGSFLDSEKSEYTLIATVDVKGATFDPNDLQTMKKVEAPKA